MIYTSFDELNGRTLEPGDCVCIGTEAGMYELTVKPSWLSGGQRPQSPPLVTTSVFASLNVDAQALARKAYGYDAQGSQNGFPISRPYDLEGMTRLTLALFLIADGAQAFQLKMYNRHWKHVDVHQIAAA